MTTTVSTKVPKKIAIVSYDLNPSSLLTTDAIAVEKYLNSMGYATTLVNQWALNEPDMADFKNAAYWSSFDGIVICSFYGSWNLRELILSQKPVICLNSGYADDLGLGELPTEHVSESSFNVVNNTHQIMTGMSLGAHSAGSAVWLDSISTFNHYVDVLATTLANNTVLAAHKSHKIVYFGWYRMSQAVIGSLPYQLLGNSARWAFGI